MASGGNTPASPPLLVLDASDRMRAFCTSSKKRPIACSIDSFAARKNTAASSCEAHPEMDMKFATKASDGLVVGNVVREKLKECVASLECVHVSIK